jgi:L-ascorbate metabolism protein UlaG (beta-lactamase superfamily)
MGGRLAGARLERAERSAHFADGRFRNLAPDQPTSAGLAFAQLRHELWGKEQRVPPGPIPVTFRHGSDYAADPPSGLRITWMGHATALVELDGRRVLTDPVWSERASPVAAFGPKRFHPPPIALAELPPVDVVVISHDHFDHLDMQTVRQLAARGAHFVVPLGVGAHLEAWGIPQQQFSELDWGERTQLAGLVVTAAPARHYSGRNPLRANQTLWASWIIEGPAHRVFYSGDTGYTRDFRKIGEDYGPFDVTLMKIGASDPSWADIHMTPEEAVQAHLDLKGRVLFPVHWGTFNLAFHAWNEPIERVSAAANKTGETLVAPRPGELVEPDRPKPVDHWWRLLR